MQAPGAAPARNAELSIVWEFLKPGFDHILRSPLPEAGKPPDLDTKYYSAAYTACYNYVTSTKPRRSGTESNNLHRPLGYDLWLQMESLFTEVAQERHKAIPAETQDTVLVTALNASFEDFSVRLKTISRILSYLDRYTVNRAVQEGHGWFAAPIIQEVAVADQNLGASEETAVQRAAIDEEGQRSADVEKRKRDILKERWGYETSTDLAQAEASAEAGSPQEALVHVSNLGYRCFRISVIEPLLEDTDKRLLHAVNNLVQSSTTENLDAARGLHNLIIKVGIPTDNAFRKQVADFINEAQSANP
jgi:hypothetical protein